MISQELYVVEKLKENNKREVTFIVIKLSKTQKII